MSNGKSIVRQQVEKIPGVTRTWFEWQIKEVIPEKILVIEVDAGTDPDGVDFGKSLLDSIYLEVKDALANKTTMIVSAIRIVPTGHYGA